MLAQKNFKISLVKGGNLGPLNAVGIATREVPDYADDIVVVSGMQTRDADVILLADHDQTKPIGRARLSVSGNEVKAYITFAPEGTTETADEYRKLCKAGVVTDLSVGFNPIERKMIDGGGWRYTKWQCLEVSLVAVGCNPAAVIVQRSRKSGRVLSGSNATKLQQAHDAAENCRALVADVLDGASAADDPDDDGAKSMRRRALDVAALRLSSSISREIRMAELRQLDLKAFRSAS